MFAGATGTPGQEQGGNRFASSEGTTIFVKGFDRSLGELQCCLLACLPACKVLFLTCVGTTDGCPGGWTRAACPGTCCLHLLLAPAACTRLPEMLAHRKAAQTVALCEVLLPVRVWQPGGRGW